MSSLTFNVAKGRLATLFALPAANDAIEVVVLKENDPLSDAAMRDKDVLLNVYYVSGRTREHPDMLRQTVTGIVVAVDQDNDLVSISCDDITWPEAIGGTTTALVFYYNPDTTADNQGISVPHGEGAANDIYCIPLIKLDFVITPNGGDITTQFPADGLAVAQ